jgi:pimeloyl-ACP methyl ester carboxylesterase
MSKINHFGTEVRGFSRRNLFRTTGASGLALGSALFTPSVAEAKKEWSDDRGPIWTPARMPEPVNQTEGMVEVADGVKLWYWDTGGTGEPLILMHAGTGSGNVWGYQQPVFAQAGYRVIGYSRRGYYKSDAGSNDDPGCAGEDLGKLIEHLKLDEVNLLAAAHGGYFLLDFVLNNPNKVRSIVMLSSLMGVTDEDFVQANARIRPTFFANLPHSFQELSPSYRAGNPEGLALWEQLTDEAIPGTRINSLLSKPLTWTLLETIKHPTLLITGDGDLYLPPSLLRMQALHMKQAEVRIIDEAGHSGNWEQPEIFNEMVLKFLANHQK